jgi:hypothetical protein
LTLTDPATGSYEICPVCFWEDRPVQNEDPAFSGGANSVSLAQARENYICENYIQYGACKPEFSGKDQLQMQYMRGVTSAAQRRRSCCSLWLPNRCFFSGFRVSRLRFWAMFKSNIAAILLAAWTQLPLRNLRVVFQPIGTSLYNEAF